MRGAGEGGVRPVMPQALLLALHLRDAARLVPPVTGSVPELPPLEPAVPPMRSAGAAPAGRRAAGVQWATWWARNYPGGPRALTAVLPPRFPSLRGMPELRGLAELGMDDAVAWCAHARRAEARVLATTPVALFETGLVAEVERETGMRLRPFALDVVVLPLQGARSWDLPGGPLLTLGLRADRDAYLAWLRARLHRMAAARARSR